MRVDHLLAGTSLIALVFFAGCARTPTRAIDGMDSTPPIEATTQGGVQSTAPAATPPKQGAARPAPKPRPPAGEEILPVTPAEPAREFSAAGASASTGVPVCDQYLAAFKLCHRTIGQYTPAQIDDRFERTRDGLMRKSGTPEGRAQISRSCKVLASAMTAELGKRTCGDPPG